MEEATKCGKLKLVDSNGYSYNVKRTRGGTTDWQCTIRPKANQCRASVIQQDGLFQAGKKKHNHVADVGAATAARITKTTKSKAMDDLFKPASAIVKEVMKALLLRPKAPSHKMGSVCFCFS